MQNFLFLFKYSHIFPVYIFNSFFLWQEHFKVQAIEQQVFPEHWCGHQIFCTVGEMWEKRLEDLTPSCIPVAQKLPVTIKPGNFSEHISLPVRGTQPPCCHAAQWLFWAQVDIWANTSSTCSAGSKRERSHPGWVKCRTCTSNQWCMTRWEGETIISRRNWIKLGKQVLVSPAEI